MTLVVVVAVVTNAEREFLITKRPAHIPMGGLWEFPGGKLEPNETPVSALIRELKEEVDLEIRHPYFLGDVFYARDDKSIQLVVFHVDRFEGNARCCEGQEGLQWVPFDALKEYDFPPANVEIFKLIQEKIF